MSSFVQHSLGQGFKGQNPGLYGFMDGGGERSSSRLHLRKAFGNLYNKGLDASPVTNNVNILGPFRTAFNAGDILTNKNESTNIRYGRAPNQVGGNNLSRLQGLGDGTSNSGNAMYSGNTRFVHDGSDYIRFKKLQALNKNYNDKSFGGAENSQSQHAIRNVRK